MSACSHQVCSSSVLAGDSHKFCLRHTPCFSGYVYYPTECSSWMDVFNEDNSGVFCHKTSSSIFAIWNLMNQDLNMPTIKCLFGMQKQDRCSSVRVLAPPLFLIYPHRVSKHSTSSSPPCRRFRLRTQPQTCYCRSSHNSYCHFTYGSPIYDYGCGKWGQHTSTGEIFSLPGSFTIWFAQPNRSSDNSESPRSWRGIFR